MSMCFLQTEIDVFLTNWIWCFSYGLKLINMDVFLTYWSWCWSYLTDWWWCFSKRLKLFFLRTEVSDVIMLQTKVDAEVFLQTEVDEVLIRLIEINCAYGVLINCLWSDSKNYQICSWIWLTEVDCLWLSDC